MRLRLLKTFASLLLFLSVSVFSQKADGEIPQIPDSLRKKIENENAVFSIQEARELRNAIRGDSTDAADAIETPIIPKDSLFGTHVNPLIVGTEVLGLNAFSWYLNFHLLGS